MKVAIRRAITEHTSGDGPANQSSTQALPAASGSGASREGTLHVLAVAGQ